MVGHPQISFLDAFEGYHRIPLALANQEKTAFVTPTGNYHYRVMPFGLKNAESTYQRMMTSMFESRLGKNIEVYINNMVVKSRVVTDHLSDLGDIFEELKLILIKLKRLIFYSLLGILRRYKSWLEWLQPWIGLSLDPQTGIDHFFSSWISGKGLNGMKNVPLPSNSWKTTFLSHLSCLAAKVGATLGRGAPSTSNGGFQIGTLGRRSNAISVIIPSVEDFLCALLAILAPFWGSRSFLGITSPSSSTFFPFLSRFLFLSAGSKREICARRGVGGRGWMATSRVAPSVCDSRSSRMLVFCLR